MASYAQANTAVRGLISNLNEAIGKMNEATKLANSTSALVISKGAEIKKGVEGIRKVAEEGKYHVENILGEAKQKKSDFDGLIELFKGSQSEFAESLLSIAEQVKTGDVTLQEFLNRFGNIKAELGIGGKTIQELVQSMNLAPLQEEIAGIRKRMQGDLGGIEDVMKRLTEVNSEAARQLIMILDLWKKGRLSLEEVIDRIKLLEEAVPEGTTTDQLLQDVSDYLTASQRSGG